MCAVTLVPLLQLVVDESHVFCLLVDTQYMQVNSLKLLKLCEMCARMQWDTIQFTIIQQYSLLVISANGRKALRLARNF